MSIANYIAYENIEQYSPVFIFNCEKDSKKYVYTSQNLFEQPYCIGICINSPKKGQKAKVQLNGTTKVRYYGSYPVNDLQVYIVKSFKSTQLTGYVSGFEKDIIPLQCKDAFVIKIGTIYTKKCGKPDFEVKSRIVNVALNIDNESTNLYNIYTFEQLTKENIVNENFSYFDIGVDLKTGLENPLVK